MPRTARLLVVDPLPPALLAAVQAAMPAEVDVVRDLSTADLARRAGEAEVLLVVHRPIDAGLLALAPRVRLVQVFGIGYDNVDLAAAAARGVLVANNPGSTAVPVAEHTVMLMLVLLKRLLAAEHDTRAGGFPTMQIALAGIGDLQGAAVGLVGLGRTGSAVAERLRAFGTVVRYTARRRRDAATEAALGVSFAPLDELLRSSGILSLHLPLSDATRCLFGERELALLPRGALLVNTSRGELVEPAALRQAIASGHLGGAALDVLDDEASGTNPFADLPQVIVTPHLAGMSRAAIQGALRATAANMRRYLAGEPVDNVVGG